ncbi:unnamed protein product [Kuraishia capsulata CBS 1993]|uniref:Phosphatidylinositol-specific phospholipase C X domain-containing protein n=1 Tax=Kuraishia capsulata CBS 1993 TaxID=1382522 RepID=W6MKJ9_9ASCO|nr:uncharacterized protein KUCA_T00002881001 [Kuraishia capsulata CBS 1993]CDK26906.1 unnamed protein product [Kuraishia capsulata CBS 1993]
MSRQISDQDLSEWQRQIGDDVAISKLSLPGTHNSAASHLSLFSVKCQGAPITEQLNHGVRFLDIRVSTPFFNDPKGWFGKNKKDLQVIHGQFPVKLPTPVKLHGVLDEVYGFLEKHPSESVIVSIKSEGRDKWEGQDFPNLIWDEYVSPKQDKWYLSPSIPRMGECRGKVILFRRFGVDDSKKNSYGIDASWWQYNTTMDDRGNYVVQDWCEVMKKDDINTKSQYVKDHLSRAIEYNSTDSQNPKLYVNFCSGANFFDPDCWPKKVASGLTSLKIEDNYGKGCGIVVLDYIERENWKEVKTLVSTNY